MSIQVKKIDDRTQWDAFLASQPCIPFVQSPAYATFYRELGEQAWIYGVFKDHILIGGSIVIGIHAKRGNFLYLPYGPVASKADMAEVLQALTTYMKKMHKDEYAFIRSCPFIDETDTNKQIFATQGYRPAPMHMLAETTWLLDIRPEPDTLMAGMKKNHRNLIRRCIKEGVTIEMDTDPKSVAALNDLLDVTVKRHKFHRFSRTYVEKEFEAFKKQGSAIAFRAYLPDGTLDAAAIIICYGNMAAYRHGASLGSHKKIPSSYLIQWEAIQEAKRRGIAWYNFWGIAPEDAAASHPFKGITHFKKGFGGMQKDLLHCQDYPLKWTYSINWIIETARRIRRGFS